ncbi:hypothetical protein [Neobacillus cucumis]|uniref:Uncharacterized protein n=1 Tax=Neobacillus cucumis TaxID=1740721 RepID=A0A2N5H8K2_9BACI|nr:hypothetical protein [Neobacillus cucumis]PLS01830.1 hypothetical protein CVD27_23050 [Neobacillus cucumis]
MDLNTFIRLYQEFLIDCEQKGWMVEVLIEEFGNYLAAITNYEGIEVQFYIELDIENCVNVTETTKQSRLDYGVIRDQGGADLFAKEVLDEFHQYWRNHLPKRYSSFILYKG